MNLTLSRRGVLAAGAVAAVELLAGKSALAADENKEHKHRVVVWSEGTAPKNVYPHDIRGAVADGLKPLEAKGWEIVTATITDPDQGVPQASLDKTDVLVWWGHQLHGKVKDNAVKRIVDRVNNGGMGFIALHSAHFSKALKALLKTNCGWKGGYIEDGSKLDMVVKDKDHPIARGIKDFSIPHTERYTEPFECPEPEAVVFDGVYTRPDGTKEHSRQGLTFNVGKGRVFYFQPGHETYPIFFDENMLKIMCNAVEWAGKAE